MFGPPGCSKTMIAKAIATESKLNFISIKCSDLFSKWLGDSERAVRELFERAKQVAPSIVFLDELDALAGQRSSSNKGGSNVEESVTSQLLTVIDGCESLNDVIVIGATNRPDLIDSVFIKHFFFCNLFGLRVKINQNVTIKKTFRVRGYFSF